MRGNIILSIIGTISKEFFDFGVLIFRVGIGAMISIHGFDKLIHFQEKAPGFLDPFGIGGELSLVLAIFAEGFCSLLIITGFSLRLALVPLITTMLIAFFVAHSDDPYNVKEIALLYLVAFSSLFVMGPGKFSFDYLFLDKLRRLNE